MAESHALAACCAWLHEAAQHVLKAAHLDSRPADWPILPASSHPSLPTAPPSRCATQTKSTNLLQAAPASAAATPATPAAPAKPFFDPFFFGMYYPFMWMYYMPWMVRTATATACVARSHRAVSTTTCRGHRPCAPGSRVLSPPLAVDVVDDAVHVDVVVSARLPLRSSIPRRHHWHRTRRFVPSVLCPSAARSVQLGSDRLSSCALGVSRACLRLVRNVLSIETWDVRIWGGTGR